MLIGAFAHSKLPSIRHRLRMRWHVIVINYDNRNLLLLSSLLLLSLHRSGRVPNALTIASRYNYIVLTYSVLHIVNIRYCMRTCSSRNLSSRIGLSSGKTNERLRFSPSQWELAPRQSFGWTSRKSETRNSRVSNRYARIYSAFE